MKKGRKLLLIILTFLFVFDSSMVYAKKFRDTRGHWAEYYISEMSDSGYVNGYDSDIFKPNNAISKVEFFAIINSMANLKRTYTVTFSDVSTSDWFYKEVSKAIKAGYLTPTTGRLNPNGAISRQEVMGVIGYMYKLKQNPKYLSRFSDQGAFTSDNRGYAGTLVKLGVVSGDPSGRLRPNDNISRAEICKMLFAIMEEYGLPSERVVVDSKIKFGDRNLYN